MNIWIFILFIFTRIPFYSKILLYMFNYTNIPCVDSALPHQQLLLVKQIFHDRFFFSIFYTCREDVIFNWIRIVSKLYGFLWFLKMALYISMAWIPPKCLMSTCRGCCLNLKWTDWILCICNVLSGTTWFFILEYYWLLPKATKTSERCS